jgi:hypothetical protein
MGSSEDEYRPAAGTVSRGANVMPSSKSNDFDGGVDRGRPVGAESGQPEQVADGEPEGHPRTMPPAHESGLLIYKFRWAIHDEIGFGKEPSPNLDL